MRKIYCFYLLLLCVATNAQTNTLSLFFAINEFNIHDHKQRLDSLSSALATKNATISIYGYADFLHTDIYNQHLSVRRAVAVKDYIVSRTGTVINIEACKGFGETHSVANAEKKGEPKERRVDIIVAEQPTRKIIGNRHNKVHDSLKINEPEIPKESEKPGILKNIEELKKGESYTVEGLNFIPGRHMLVKSAIPVLEELLATLKEHPDLKIEIQGHICCVLEEADGFDYDAQDMKLSENRAKAIYNYLIRNGISKKRLTYKGYGRTNPKIKFEKTPEDEQINRRVEIKILEN